MLWLRYSAFIHINIRNKTSVAREISSHFCCSVCHVIHNIRLPSLLILCKLICKRIVSKCSHWRMVLSCIYASFRNIRLFWVRPKRFWGLFKVFSLLLSSVIILLIGCLIEFFTCACRPSWLSKPSWLSSLGSGCSSFAFSSRKKEIWVVS